MFDTLGARIIYCRGLLSLSRSEMAKKVSEHVSLPTLTRWELNKVNPSAKKIEFLMNFFINEGIKVAKDWMQHGIGLPPNNTDFNKSETTISFDELVYLSLISIRNAVKDFYFQQVNSNFFKPFVVFGDYVGGVIEENWQLVDGELCFLFAKDVAAVGVYHYQRNVFHNLNGKLKKIDQFDKVLIGKVQWVIRRP